MSRFISWIEVTIDGKPVPFFLTDREMPHLPPEVAHDPFGHNAIREYYKQAQPSLDLSKGKLCENRYFFWSRDRYPKEIRALLKDEKTIRKTWGQMIGKHFGVDEIGFVFDNGPERAQWMVASLVESCTTDPAVAQKALSRARTLRDKARLIGVIVEAKDAESAHASLTFVPSLTLSERSRLIGIIEEKESGELAHQILEEAHHLTTRERSRLIAVIDKTGDLEHAYLSLSSVQSLTRKQRSNLIEVIEKAQSAQYAYNSFKNILSLTILERSRLLSVMEANIKGDESWIFFHHHLTGAEKKRLEAIQAGSA
jgi:hypothetical protein